jgi:hypothetical protein
MEWTSHPVFMLGAMITLSEKSVEEAGDHGDTCSLRVQKTSEDLHFAHHLTASIAWFNNAVIGRVHFFLQSATLHRPPACALRPLALTLSLPVSIFNFTWPCAA